MFCILHGHGQVVLVKTISSKPLSLFFFSGCVLDVWCGLFLYSMHRNDALDFRRIFVHLWRTFLNVVNIPVSRSRVSKETDFLFNLAEVPDVFDSKRGHNISSRPVHSSNGNHPTKGHPETYHE